LNVFNCGKLNINAKSKQKYTGEDALGKGVE